MIRLIAIPLLLAASAAFGREFRTEFGPARHLVAGQPFTLSLIAENTPLPQWPNPGSVTFTGFEWLSTDTSSNADKHVLTFTFTSFDTGWHEMPALPVIIGTDTLLSDTFRFNIELMDVDTSGNPMDIKAIYEASAISEEKAENRSWWQKNWPWVAAGGALLLGLILFLLFRKKKTEIIEAPKVILPPYEEAMARLQELETSGLWQQGKHKQFHIELSEILRNYIQRRYGIMALEQTTDELSRSIRAVVSNKELQTILRQTLELSDLAKFARYSPLGAENEACMMNARKFVGATRPREDRDTTQNSHEDA
jgi:LPXTG-motif cell wall-anchored protein